MEIANVWNNEFGFNYNDDDDEKTPQSSFYTSQKLISAFEKVWKFARQYNLCLSDIFNSVNYDTYYGNFAHGICKKIFDILKDDTISAHSEQRPPLVTQGTIEKYTSINGSSIHPDMSTGAGPVGSCLTNPHSRPYIVDLLPEDK